MFMLDPKASKRREGERIERNRSKRVEKKRTLLLYIEAIQNIHAKSTHIQFPKTPNSNQLNPTAKSLQYNNVLRTKNEKMGTSSSNSPPPQPAL
jgi:hypothetical protein